MAEDLRLYCASPFAPSVFLDRASAEHRRSAAPRRGDRRARSQESGIIVVLHEQINHRRRNPMSNDNIALVKRGYDAFATGDLGAIRAMGAEDEVWETTLGGAPGFKYEYRGPDEVQEFFAHLQERTGGTFKDVPEAFMNVDDDRVAVLDHITATRDGRTLDHHVVHIFKMQDGKIGRVSEYSDNPRVIADFYS